MWSRQGPACHTGEESCFYRKRALLILARRKEKEGIIVSQEYGNVRHMDTLSSDALNDLYRVVLDRQDVQ